jgi:hypothetical protein
LSAYAASHHAGDSTLAANRAAIDRHFSAGSVPAIVASLKADGSEFAVKTLEVMATRSPLMMCVTHELIQRGAALDVAGCLRMERALVRRNFENGEVIEGVRALVIDKDNAAAMEPATLDEVSDDMVHVPPSGRLRPSTAPPTRPTTPILARTGVLRQTSIRWWCLPPNPTANSVGRAFI